jgi:hypothetical protein
MAMETPLMQGREVNEDDLIESIDSVPRTVLFGSLKEASPGFARRRELAERFRIACEP